MIYYVKLVEWYLLCLWTWVPPERIMQAATAEPAPAP